MNTTQFNLTPKKIGLIAAGVVVAILAIVVLTGYIGAHNTGNAKVQALNAQFPDNQNELASYVNGFYEMLGVANAKTAATDKVITDAVKGRYDNPNGSKAQPLQGTALFSAIAEAYPDVKGLNVYDKIVEYIAAKREAYKSKQSKLLDQVRDFETFRGNFPTSFYGALGAIPTGKLRAQVGNKTWRGEDALDKMRAIVTNSATENAYTSGKQEPLTVPSPVAPAPTTTTG